MRNRILCIYFSVSAFVENLTEGNGCKYRLLPNYSPVLFRCPESKLEEIFVHLISTFQIFDVVKKYKKPSSI